MSGDLHSEVETNHRALHLHLCHFRQHASNEFLVRRHLRALKRQKLGIDLATRAHLDKVVLIQILDFLALAVLERDRASFEEAVCRFRHRQARVGHFRLLHRHEVLIWLLQLII